MEHVELIWCELSAEERGRPNPESHPRCGHILEQLRPNRPRYKATTDLRGRPTLSESIMTALNYTLPPPIYLPSSGGYTSSRFTEDVSAALVVWAL